MSKKKATSRPTEEDDEDAIFPGGQMSVRVDEGLAEAWPLIMERWRKKAKASGLQFTRRKKSEVVRSILLEYAECLRAGKDPFGGPG